MMRGMAHALGFYGIQVNSLAHGRQEENGGTSTEIAERLRRLPLGRLGRAEDLVGPAIFLASDDSDYVTGTVLYADGGYTTASVTDDEHRPKQIPYVGD
jgi:NAD(P)-dependent dehydrogenase (short-subunit alcohol dehydrogenase family)